MTYLVLNSVFLLLIILVFILFGRVVLKSGRLYMRPVIAAALLLLLLTAVFDSLIIAQGIVGYDLQKISGIYIMRAPIEDFAYTIAATLIVSLLWEYYEQSRKK